MGLTKANCFRLVIVSCTVAAIALQWMVQYKCDFALFKEDDTIGVGVWFLMNDNTCLGEPYNPEEIDPFITTARAALSSSMSTGLIGGLVVFFEFLLCEVCCASCIAMISYISAWILSACTFIIYLCEPCVGFGFEEVQQLDSSTFADTAIDGNQCDYGPASTLNAVACILYLICAILFCCTPSPEPVCRKDRY